MLSLLCCPRRILPGVVGGRLSRRLLIHCLFASICSCWCFPPAISSRIFYRIYILPRYLFQEAPPKAVRPTEPLWWRSAADWWCRLGPGRWLIVWPAGHAAFRTAHLPTQPGPAAGRARRGIVLGARICWLIMMHIIMIFIIIIIIITIITIITTTTTFHKILLLIIIMCPGPTSHPALCLADGRARSRASVGWRPNGVSKRVRRLFVYFVVVCSGQTPKASAFCENPQAPPEPLGKIYHPRPPTSFDQTLRVTAEILCVERWNNPVTLEGDTSLGIFWPVSQLQLNGGACIVGSAIESPPRRRAASGRCPVLLRGRGGSGGLLFMAINSYLQL